VRIFFDSSAFAKRYLAEHGSDEVLQWCDKADELLLSSIALPEIISAMNQLVREDRLSTSQYQSVKGDLINDVVDVPTPSYAPTNKLNTPV
jgi:uncharacterized protein